MLGVLQSPIEAAGHQIQVPVKVKAPRDWIKMSGTKDFNRYYSPESEKLVRKLKEARERETAAVEDFHLRVCRQSSGPTAS